MASRCHEMARAQRSEIASGLGLRGESG